MSNDITVQAVIAPRLGGDAATGPKPTAETAPPAEPTAAPSPIANPTLRLDAALGLVVIEFRNDAGAVTTSIPSQRQLEAYQRWETTRLGPAPDAVRGGQGSRNG